MDAKLKYNELRKRVKANIMKGDVEQIAKAAKKTPEHIRLVLRSEGIYNPFIIGKAVKVIADRERKTESMLKQLG